MSYFNQISTRARSSAGVMKPLPYLQPTRSLFRPSTVIQSLEGSEAGGLWDETGLRAVSPPLITPLTAEPTSAPVTNMSSNDVLVDSPSPIALSSASSKHSTATPQVIVPVSTTPPSEILPTVAAAIPPPVDATLPTSTLLADLNSPSGEQCLSISQSSTVEQTQLSERTGHQTNPEPGIQSLRSAPSARPLPLSAQKEPASSITQTLQPSALQSPALQPLQSTAASIDPSAKIGDNLVANEDSSISLETVKPISPSLTTRLEPHHAANRLNPIDKIDFPRQEALPILHPETVNADKPQTATIQIGTIDIQITPPPVKPQPRKTRSKSTPKSSLSRGFTSSFGLRQG